MVKGKRRTHRTSKEELDNVKVEGPKGPKDSRLEHSQMLNGGETKLLNGAVDGLKKNEKITSYFSPIRANCATAVNGDITECLSESKLSYKNENVILTTPQKINRSICTRSQTRKDLDLSNAITHNALNKRVESLTDKFGDDSSMKKVPEIHDEKVPEILHESLHEDGPSHSPKLSSSPNSSPTLHKIQALNEEKLRLDSPLSPSTAFSKLKLSNCLPKNLDLKGCKAKKKLLLQPSNKTNANYVAKNEKPKSAPSTNHLSNALTNGNIKSARSTHITEFFPIRRSERKPKTKLLEEKQKLIETKILSGVEEGLMVIDCGPKGRGVVTTRKFLKGEFVVEYIGELVDIKKAKEREQKYSLDTSKGCYMYYFNFYNNQYCIDATEETGYLGRLVNHSRSGNLVTKAVEVTSTPHLILIAKHDLEAGTELLYDYGDRTKEALEHHPWLAQ